MNDRRVFGPLFGRLAKRPALRGRALMVVGTASHVGKSWVATAICRHLRRRGLKVAPFKAQNMSLNSYVCADGGEIGRAQVAQAEACGIEPRTEMNPILLKPSGEQGSQVIVNGRVWKTLPAQEYYQHYDELLEQVESAFQRLSAEYDFIVMEGAGGAAEINLRSRDLVNLPLAARLGAPALLVADIDRGGVFASVLGTFSLLEVDELSLLDSFIVNRFQGDLQIFNEGRRMLEERAGRPCLGVFPYTPEIRLDEEDILCLDDRPRPPRATGGLKIAIIRLPHISNTTDFRLLPQADYVTEATPYEPDLVILPGTKNTLEDLAWMRRAGIDKWILDRRKQGAAIWGVCGGYQMLGRSISDPDAVESNLKRLPGLGLLPTQTVMAPEKTTRQVRAKLALGDIPVDGYEIHMGESHPPAGQSPFCFIDGRPEGYLRRGILGTYLHGVLENDRVLTALLADVADWRRKTAPQVPPDGGKDVEYEKLADWFEASADLRKFQELYLP